MDIVSVDCVYTQLCKYACPRTGKKLGSFLPRVLRFFSFLGFFRFLGFNLQMPDTSKRFGHVSATNRNSYLNIICIKLVTPVKN